MSHYELLLGNLHAANEGPVYHLEAWCEHCGRLPDVEHQRKEEQLNQSEELTEDEYQQKCDQLDEELDDLVLRSCIVQEMEGPEWLPNPRGLVCLNSRRRKLAVEQSSQPHRHEHGLQLSFTYICCSVFATELAAAGPADEQRLRWPQAVLTFDMGVLVCPGE